MADDPRKVLTAAMTPALTVVAGGNSVVLDEFLYALSDAVLASLAAAGWRLVRTEPCRNCGGTGTGGARLLLGEWFDGKCPRCDGTGAEQFVEVAKDDLRWLLDVVRWTDRATGLGAMDPCPHLIQPIPPGVRVLLDEMEE